VNFLEKQMQNNCFIIGGTGMVGKQLLKQLLTNNKYASVTLIARRPLNVEELAFFPNQSKLVIKLVDFDKLQEHKDVFITGNFSTGFCTLGSTRAQAGSAEAFIKIDHDIPLECAKLFKEALGSKEGRFSLLTSKGSDKNSYFLYPQTKGKLEQDIIDLNFKNTSIYRPGLLLFEGERPKTRFFEGVGISLVKMLGISKGSARVEDVATAMRVMDETDPTEEVSIFENEEINRLGL
jgi:oxidoreductase